MVVRLSMTSSHISKALVGLSLSPSLWPDLWDHPRHTSFGRCLLDAFPVIHPGSWMLRSEEARQYLLHRASAGPPVITEMGTGMRNSVELLYPLEEFLTLSLAYLRPLQSLPPRYLHSST
ncbi:hypothetical protein FS842_005757 [Serendipita sp. 407]|nr:hypothetical protein FS842_005757 [Serendipita sp. 407]